MNSTLTAFQALPASSFAINWKQIALGRSLQLVVVLLIVFATYRLATFFIRRYVGRQAISGSRAEMRHQQQVRTVADLGLSTLTGLVVAFTAVTTL